MLVRRIAGQHSPAAQVHQPNELEDVEGRETWGEEGSHPETTRGAQLATVLLGSALVLRIRDVYSVLK